MTFACRRFSPEGAFPIICYSLKPSYNFFDLEQTELIADYPNSALYYVPSDWKTVKEAYQ